ncbi:hypothetical protein PM082_010662 [Marasmius tenuissimus]|nr:hypothetical protein PM082_010662 [Marasmius tenuissimus]
MIIWSEFNKFKNQPDNPHISNSPYRPGPISLSSSKGGRLPVYLLSSMRFSTMSDTPTVQYGLFPLNIDDLRRTAEVKAEKGSEVAGGKGIIMGNVCGKRGFLVYETHNRPDNHVTT